MRVWLAVLSLVVPAAPAAAALSTGTLRLADVLAEAARVNPGLQAARSAWEAAAQVPAQAAALPDPEVEEMHVVRDRSMPGDPMMDQFSVSQTLPFWGKRALRGQAASLDAEMAEQAYRAKAWEVRSEAVKAYEEIFYLDRTVQILGEQESVLRRVARVAEQKYAVGREPQASVFRAQVELARLGTDLLTAREEAVSARARLNALLDRPPLAPLGTPQAGRVPAGRWDGEALAQAALAGRPELLALRALAGRRDAERRLALRRYFPDFMVGYAQTGDASDSLPYDGRASQSLRLGVSLPVWLGKTRAAARESRSARDAARLSLADLVNETRWRVADLSVRCETAARLDALYGDTVLPQARAALDAAQGAYEAGETGFQDLLDAQRQLLRSELEQARHRADFRIARAELERVVAEPLPQPQGEAK